MNHQAEVQAAYQQLRAELDCQVLGMVEIGSYARDEAVTWSDRDIRLVVHSDQPYLVMREHQWTDSPPLPVRLVDWADLDRFEQVTFGITNLAFTERVIEAGKFPLNDHTCLYQGRLLLDEDDRIADFCQRYAKVRFANIVPDYLAQIGWRASNRLQAEFSPDQPTLGLDDHKRAIAVVQTSCRLMRDMANVTWYQQLSEYVSDFATLDQYYRQRWPEYLALFEQSFALKRDELQRQAAFVGLRHHDPDWISHIRGIQAETLALWQQFEHEF